MIISASRRTDIPTYYSEWFLNRIKAGYALVRNPMNPHQVSRISLSPDVVDGIVFFTKNPIPMLGKLDALKEYMYVFQFTLTPYGRDMETHVPSKAEQIIPAFQRLSDLIGPDRVIWRYDPILLNGLYTVDYHIRYFEGIAQKLHSYTRQCTISFVDLYQKTRRNAAGLALREILLEEQNMLAKALSEIAHGYGLQISTCAEDIDLDRYGIAHARCIDGRLFERLLGCPLDAKKDANQRAECGCMESVEVGAYHTCLNGCKYCYANHSPQIALTNAAKHNPQSPLLLGELAPGDRVTERKMRSLKVGQIGLELG